MSAEGGAGVIFKSYLDIMTDKLQDGFYANAAFEKLRSVTGNNVHVTWDGTVLIDNNHVNIITIYIYIYVCVYVCICICMYGCLYIYVYMYTYMHAYTHTHTHTHTYIHI